jgi:hypothetical protein
MKTLKLSLVVLTSLLAVHTVAQARVKLVALPERARVVVSLSNPQATLVEEERILTLQKGDNTVDFSWRGVNIDPSSIQMRFMSHPDKFPWNAVTTSYPPNENALIWTFGSPEAFEERVRISYILLGLQKDIVYKAVAESDEKALTLRNYLRLRNNSGEDLDDAEVSVGYGELFKKTISHEEVLEMLSEKIDTLPIQKILTWDAVERPWDPEYQKDTVGIPLSYKIMNDKASKLGEHTLLPGKARIFLKTRELDDAGKAKPEGGVAFIGEDWVQLTPVDRELKLYIGQSRDVKVTQRKMKEDRVNLRRNNNNQLVVWDVDEEYKIEIENFKKDTVTLVVINHIPGYWEMKENSHAEFFTKKDAYTIEYEFKLAPETSGDKKTVVNFKLQRKNVMPNVQDPMQYQ